MMTMVVRKAEPGGIKEKYANIPRGTQEPGIG
jgi:hypothetical protein